MEKKVRTLKPRQRKILAALVDLGGRATTKQIAEEADLNTNGVSQSLGALVGEHVHLVKSDHGESVWEIVRD